MIYYNIHDCSSLGVPCACTVGMFDGVHVGHRHLLSRLRTEAEARGLRPLVVTFDRHPKLALGGKLELLMHLQERLHTLEALGFDVVVLPFTPQVSALSACQFAQQYLVRLLGMRLLVLGYDNRFGNRQHDDFASLGRLGFELVHDEPVAVEGITVSSTKVRHALQEGQVVLAEKLLGQRYSLDGEVVHGRHVGSSLGFPTANVQVEHLLLPREGVYAVAAQVEGLPDTLSGMVNIGPQPTFDSDNKVVEVNLFAPCGDLYGRHIRLSLVERLRDIRRFDSPQALTAQLREDKRHALSKIGTLLVALLLAVASFAQPNRTYRSLDEVTDPALVVKLDLHKQRLHTFPPEIFTFSNLEELNLSRTRLQEVPDSLHLLPRLRVLNLSRNPLLALPPSLASLTQLQQLTLYLTGIVALPSECKSLNYTLQVLDLRACPLTYDDQEALTLLLPTPKKRWDHVCNCQ